MHGTLFKEYILQICLYTCKITLAIHFCLRLRRKANFPLKGIIHSVPYGLLHSWKKQCTDMQWSYYGVIKARRVPVCMTYLHVKIRGNSFPHLSLHKLILEEPESQWKWLLERRAVELFVRLSTLPTFFLPFICIFFYLSYV
jgi:hypothetical protein